MEKDCFKLTNQSIKGILKQELKVDLDKKYLYMGMHCTKVNIWTIILKDKDSFKPKITIIKEDSEIILQMVKDFKEHHSMNTLDSSKEEKKMEKVL